MAPQPPPLAPDAVPAVVRDAALSERGAQLWERGAVQPIARRGVLLLGEVRGSETLPYSVGVEAPPAGKRRWVWRCTCPFFELYGGPCKHGAALLFAWANAPDRFPVEASLDERLAGAERVAWLELVREALHGSPDLQALLALEPEPRKPLGRPLALAPFDEQLRYALRRWPQEGERLVQRGRGTLETAAGYLRVGDPNNATRLATLLTGVLLALAERPRPLARLLDATLTLLEAAALDATWEADEQAAWLARVMGWWEEAEGESAERLLDILLHCYRHTDRAALERWLRGLLRKPVHANRLSSAAWRARVLTFLLAFYEASGRVDAFLDLCWEEGEDARAAQKLVEHGDAKEVVRVAEQGLGTSEAHRAVAVALRAQSHHDAARRVAEAGLRYPDRGRGALLAWLAARALAEGEAAHALSLAQQAWEQGPTLERYTLLGEAARQAEAWPDLRRALHASLEHRGDIALLAEIGMEEGDWQAAAALLPATGPRREELTEAVTRGMAPHEPEDALALLFDLADLRADGRSHASYTAATQALLAAQSLAWARGLESSFTARFHLFLDAHRRRPALLREVARVGLRD